MFCRFPKLLYLCNKVTTIFEKSLPKMVEKSIKDKTMKRYFKNLFIALFGNNPYQMELDRVREEYEKTTEKVAQLEDMYWKFKEQKAEIDKQVTGYQTLVENLRQRLKEKDEQLAQLKLSRQRLVNEHQKQVAAYSETIAKLQGQLNKQ